MSIFFILRAFNYTFQHITENGILTWQSQPSQKIDNKVINRLINHDHNKDNIYIFLRTDRNRDYTYLCRLAYVSHDKEREQPVYFKWQIIDWNITEKKLKEMNLTLKKSKKDKEKKKEDNVLEVHDPPTSYNGINTGVSSEEFKGQQVDFSEVEANNEEMGLAGEKLVLKHEYNYLIDNGKDELAEKIKHTSVIEGDGAGYDIKSYTLKGEVKYIEVKTTKGGKNTPFYITLNELAFSERYKENYYLYRVYNFDTALNYGKVYYKKGNIKKNFKLEAVKYRAK
ncbi:MAG: DUF3883 domain-containing protein [Halanaerobiales bacterium]|nr:DUF3883 domain-containing protein [Halanaerobiales bacterium]